MAGGQKVQLVLGLYLTTVSENNNFIVKRLLGIDCDYSFKILMASLIESNSPLWSIFLPN
jgi:hypothetical protein